MDELTPIPAGVLTETIRQLTKIRDDFRRSSVIGREVTLSPQPQGYYSDVLSDALDLLAGPARPDGVPEDAVAVKPGIRCGGCGAGYDSQRCLGCLHDFGTPESAWVRRRRERSSDLALPQKPTEPEAQR